MWIFYFMFWTAVRASEEPLYREIGDQAVLTPDSVENPIYNIRWKHGNNIAMEWFGDETSSYRQFKDCGSLDISTGVMTITGLTRNLSGIYTAEINNKVNSETQLLVISPVPKPNLTVSCERTYCVFICDGSIKDTEPVTYWWTAGEKRWNSTKQLRITKEEKEQWFICTLKNPISSNISERVSNPFMKSEAQSHNDKTRISIVIAGITSVVVVFILITIIICLICKHRKAISTVPEVNETSAQDLEAAEALNPSNDTGEDTVDGTEQAAAAAADSQSFKPQWQYAGERSGDWCDFIKTRKCSVTSDDIEEQHQENPNGKMCLAGEEYELDFKAKTKTHLMTGKARKIRRVLLPAASPPAEEETSIHITTSAAETSNEAAQAAADLQSCHPGTKPIWQYEGKKHGEWRDYMKKTSSECSVTNNDIVRQHQQNPHSIETLSEDGSPSELDVNKKPTNIPSVQVTSPQDTTSAAPPETSDETAADLQSSPNHFKTPKLNEGTRQLSNCSEKDGDVSVSSVSSDDIEKWYQEKPHDKMRLTLDGKPYELDCNKRIQTNLETKTKRKIRRVMVEPES